MRSYGPKSLISITPTVNVIQHQLEVIHSVFGKNCEIILVTGFGANKLMNSTPDHLIKIENEKYEETSVARSIGMGLRAATNDNVVIIYGDLVFNYETLKVPFGNRSAVIVDNAGGMNQSKIGCTYSNKHRLELMLYDLPNKWAQIAYLTGEELQLFKSIVWHPDKKTMYTFEVVNEIISKGGIDNVGGQ